ncbi:MAG: hypothetical protein ACPIOQ_05455, partial [Promethearchaeia archaeon]
AAEQIIGLGDIDEAATQVARCVPFHCPSTASPRHLQVCVVLNHPLCDTGSGAAPARSRGHAGRGGRAGARQDLLRRARVPARCASALHLCQQARRVPAGVCAIPVGRETARGHAHRICGLFGRIKGRGGRRRRQSRAQAPLPRAHRRAPRPSPRRLRPLFVRHGAQEAGPAGRGARRAGGERDGVPAELGRLARPSVPLSFAATGCRGSGARALDESVFQRTHAAGAAKQ